MQLPYIFPHYVCAVYVTLVKERIVTQLGPTGVVRPFSIVYLPHTHCFSFWGAHKLNVLRWEVKSYTTVDN